MTVPYAHSPEQELQLRVQPHPLEEERPGFSDDGSTGRSLICILSRFAVYDALSSRSSGVRGRCSRYAG